MGLVGADEPEKGGHIAPEDVSISPPWEVSHPVLLDPILWLLTTACAFS